MEVTVDWLLSLGFLMQGHGKPYQFYAPDEYFPIRLDVTEDQSSLWCCGKPVCDNPTQEQVRALFKGLCLQFPNGTDP